MVVCYSETVKLRGRPMKRQRAVSMFEERSDNSKPSIADFHRELLEKLHHLNPVGMRKIQPKTQEMIPVWIQIRDEFQKKLEAKKQSKKN